MTRIVTYAHRFRRIPLMFASCLQLKHFPDSRIISCSPFQAAGAEIPCLPFKLFSVAAAGQGRRHDHETTVDHALMRGLVTAGPVIRRGASSV